MTREQRSKVAKWGNLLRRQRYRWYITFNIKRLDGRYHGIRNVWPKLFLSEADAWAAIDILPVFANQEATKDRGRIVSVSVARTILAN
jgi:hypothetical protein